MMSQKRELFQNGIRKEQREQIFKKKRIITANEMLPFSIGEKGGIVVHYELANEVRAQLIQAQIPQQYYYEPPQTWEERAYQVQMLFRYLDNKDPDEELVENTIKMVVDMLGQGFPQLDKSCLVIIKRYTNFDHNINQFILKYISDLIEFFNKCTYVEMSDLVLEILYNLAVDCDVCRNNLIAYDIPYALRQWQQSSQDQIADLIMALFETEPVIQGQQMYHFQKAVNYLFNIVSDDNRMKFVPFFRQIFHYDPSTINNKVIDWISNIELIPDEYLLDTVLIFQKISNLDHHPLSLNVIDQVIRIGYKNQQLKKRRISNNVYLTLHNFALDGKRTCSQILRSDFIRQVYRSREYFDMLNRLVQCCSEDDLEQVNPEGQIIYCAAQLLQEDSISYALQLLEILESVFLRQPHYISLFNEQNGYDILCDWFRNADQQIADACDRVFKLID